MSVIIALDPRKLKFQCRLNIFVYELLIALGKSQRDIFLVVAKSGCIKLMKAVNNKM